jgi:hypothetical protein
MCFLLQGVWRMSCWLGGWLAEAGTTALLDHGLLLSGCLSVAPPTPSHTAISCS